jgi:hypothetical protein
MIRNCKGLGIKICDVCRLNYHGDCFVIQYAGKYGVNGDCENASLVEILKELRQLYPGDDHPFYILAALKEIGHKDIERIEKLMLLQ